MEDIFGCLEEDPTIPTYTLADRSRMSKWKVSCTPVSVNDAGDPMIRLDLYLMEDALFLNKILLLMHLITNYYNSLLQIQKDNGNPHRKKQNVPNINKTLTI